MRRAQRTSDLLGLKNIGPVSVRWLEEAGIRSVADLERADALEAYRRVKALHPRECNLTMLWALVGGLTNTHWLEIPPEVKDALRRGLEEGPQH